MKNRIFDSGNMLIRGRRLRRLLVNLLISAGLGLAATTQAADIKSLAEQNTAFAFDLYSHLSGSPGNVFFSPFSISTCLAMTYAGARGDTETQMGQVLHFGNDQRELHSAFGELQRQLNDAEKQKGIQLDVANALWARQGQPFLSAFLNIAKDDYHANVKQADFKTSAEAARREINDWVAQKTRDKIKDLMPAGSLDGSTRLVLANAIYFKGMWASSFEKAATSTQPFHLSQSSQIDAPLMHHQAEVKYAGDNDFQAVELPYLGGELAMVILLPRQIDGIGQLEKQLSPAFLDDLLAKMSKQKVEIFLPKFKMESRFDLKDTLSEMGMPDAFGARADFSGLNGESSRFYISGVFHKAWVEVNEEGTEAAAATGVAIKALALAKPMPPQVFRADHPFIFLIRDTQSGSVLFVGRLADPRGN